MRSHFQIHFEISRLIETSDGLLIPKNYDYWVPLITSFQDNSDSFEIHCWNEEEQIIREIKETFNNTVVIESQKLMTIIKGKLNPENKMFFIQDYLDQCGKFKWFSIFLKKYGQHYFNSEHYATEFHLYHSTEKELEFIQSTMPNETTLHKYNNIQ